MTTCYRLNCVPSKFLCWSINPWCLRMWLYWEIQPLKRSLRFSEVVGVGPSLIWLMSLDEKSRIHTHTEKKRSQADIGRGRPGTSHGEGPGKKRTCWPLDPELLENKFLWLKPSLSVACCDGLNWLTYFLFSSCTYIQSIRASYSSPSRHAQPLPACQPPCAAVALVQTTVISSLI